MNSTTTDRMESTAATDGTRFERSTRLPGWGLFAGGFALGLLVVHLGTTRPMTHELGRLQDQITGLDLAVNRLAGYRNGAAKTNSLLALLADQAHQTDAAAQALQQLQATQNQFVEQKDLAVQTTQLLAQLAEQGRQTGAAAEALDKISALQARLVDQRRATAETTRLLGLLADQQRQTQVASAALDDIRSLADKLIAQQSASVEAHAALASLDKLREEAAALNQHADLVEALDQLGALQDRITRERHSIEAAEQSLAAIRRLRATAQTEGAGAAHAQQALDMLVRLKNAALAGADQTAWAASVVEEWAKINERIAQGSATTAPARQAADELLALKNGILAGSDPEHPERARETLGELVKLRETLHGQAGELAEARTNLDGLVGLKRQVIAQTGDLADAVETLETASDLHRQFEETVQSFERVRHWMTEVLVFEDTLERVVAAIKPLADLTNLRRLSGVELRRAAKSITDARHASPAAEQAAAASQAKANGASCPSPAGLPLDVLEGD